MGRNFVKVCNFSLVLFSLTVFCAMMSFQTCDARELQMIAKGGPKVVSTDVGDKYDTEAKKITHKTSKFAKNSPVMHITLGITGLKKEEEIVGTLRAIKVTDSKGKVYNDVEVASTSIKAPGAESTVHFEFSAPTAGWPVGSYAIDILVGGGVIKTAQVTVK